ncbi:MAG TPA: hypothetical protein VES42_26250 [Pilimelia sp.]|nr:hypothetical protein [Pilimelia sp.]
MDVAPSRNNPHGSFPGAASILRTSAPAHPADADVVAYRRSAYCVLAHDAFGR